MHKSPFFLLFALAILFFSCSNPAAVRPQKLKLSTAGLVSYHAPGESKVALTRVNFEDSIRSIYRKIGLASYGLSYEVFRLGMVGYYSLRLEGSIQDKNMLTIIDFSKPSSEKRFYTIDLEEAQVKYHSYVAHGRNTGENLATTFSNNRHSNQSSMGFYVTGETYVGSKGYSLRLDGMDKNYNDQIRNRAVVIHEADYVSESWIKRYGRLGRSQGCPALPTEISREVIDSIKEKTAVFAYFPDDNYLTSSRYLKFEALMNALEQRTVQLLDNSSKVQS
jgi:hypothetical protein